MREVFTRGLYISKEGISNLISKCEVIMKRENWSFNDLVFEALTEYEVRHGVGNNSFQLDKFGITWTKAVSMNKCVFKGCDKPAIASALCVPKKQTVGVCALHLNHVRDSAKSNPHLWSDVKFPLEKKGSLA